MAQVHVVVGGQFGSEGKGHFVAQLTQKIVRDTAIDPMVIRTGGPNAGHTVIGMDGQNWKLRQIPTAAVANYESPIGIAAGSEIDSEVLNQEIYLLETAGIPILERLTVDGQATLVESYHGERERSQMVQTDKIGNVLDSQASLVERVGSTGKGIGAARADRIMREAGLYGGQGDVARTAANWLYNDRPVILEATQGYGLGLHAGYYPKCTSRDIRAIDVLAEAGISPWQHGVDKVIVWVIFRPFPIRVAGDSGPLKGETTWEALDLEPEYTTVTQKIRRVGKWDPDLAAAALFANGFGPKDSPLGEVRPILMFADQVDWELEGVTDIEKFNWEMFARYERSIDTTFWGFGTGPSTFCWRYDL